ncbi:hypothetical protein [Prevotella falsenii]
MLLPLCFLIALVRLPTPAQPLHLAVARYVFDEMPAQLLNKRTKPVKDANERLGLKGIVFPFCLRKKPKKSPLFCKDNSLKK